MAFILRGGCMLTCIKHRTFRVSFLVNLPEVEHLGLSQSISNLHGMWHVCVYMKIRTWSPVCRSLTTQLGQTYGEDRLKGWRENGWWEAEERRWWEVESHRRWLAKWVQFLLRLLELWSKNISIMNHSEFKAIQAIQKKGKWLITTLVYLLFPFSLGGRYTWMEATYTLSDGFRGCWSQWWYADCRSADQLIRNWWP